MSEYNKKVNKINHCVSALQFDKETQLKLFKLADKIRNISVTKKGMDFLSSLLSHKRAVMYFNQPSTRTYLSFCNACHIVGIKICMMPSSIASSEAKGESTEDTLKTISSYTDILILRHRDENVLDKSVDIFNNTGKFTHVINAGSGTREHPTQALLDVYTIYRTFKEIGNKKIFIIGDLKRARTVRSLIYMLSFYSDIELTFISPDELKIKKDIIDYINSKNIIYNEINKLEGLSNADIIYMTRIQDEYDISGESSLIDYSRYYITAETLKSLKKNAVILHPLPRRNEISTDIDSDNRALYWDQEVNGMWIRAALIAYIFGVQKEIENYSD